MSELPIETAYAEGFFKRFGDILGPYLPSVGISPDVLEKPSILVEIPQFAELIEVAAKGRGEECLGLHIGERLHPQDLGVLGYAITHAATVKHLLKTYVRYFGTYALGVDVNLVVNGSRASWSYQLPGVISYRQGAELALAFVHTVIQSSVCDEWKLLEVQFEHGKPKDVSEHLRIFNAPVLFRQQANSLVFDKALLNRKLKETDLRLFAVLQRHLDSVLLERSEEQDLLAQVRKIIVKSISTHVPEAAEVAEALGMPAWTFRRRLQAKGLTYSQLLADIRLYLAQTYLKNAHIPIAEVAFLLGYSEVSAFGRAFRRWSGMSPAEYRKAHLSGS